MGVDRINKCKRIIEGYVEIEYKGNSIERFINICKNNQIEIWECKNCEDKIVFCLSVDSFYKLKKIRRKCGGKIRIINRKGIPFFIHKYKYRYFFAIGCVMCVLIGKFLTMFVWNISFEGNNSYSDKELLEFLERNNIKQGILMKGVDFNDIEYIIRNGYNDITWVSAERKGTKIIIHIKENEDMYIENADEKPCNILSNVDGVIYSIITRSGKPQVRAGDEVKKGDVLVSGVLSIEDDYGETVKYRFVNADSDIYVKDVENYNEEILLENNMTAEEANQILKANLDYYIKKMEEKGIQILENNVTMYVENNRSIAKGEIKVLKSIGIKSYISDEDIDRIKNSEIRETQE